MTKKNLELSVMMIEDTDKGGYTIMIDEIHSAFADGATKEEALTELVETVNQLIKDYEENGFDIVSLMSEEEKEYMEWLRPYKNNLKGIEELIKNA